MFWIILTELCLQNNITPSNLVEKIGIARGSVTKWKNGSIPQSSTLQKIADYFGVTVDYLLGKTDQKEKPSDTEDLTAFEHIIIERLRTLSPEKLREAESYIDYLIDQQEKDNQ